MDYPIDLGIFVKPLDFLVFGLDSLVLKIYFRHSFFMIDETWTISYILKKPRSNLLLFYYSRVPLLFLSINYISTLGFRS
jgi:hypothetical protein